MRTALRLLATAGTAALVMLGLVVPAQATQPTLTVFNASADEGNWRCTASSPFGCSIRSGSLSFMFRISPAPKQAVTLSWQVDDITTTAGLDYSGPTSGTINYPANSNQVYVNVTVVTDDVAEPDETLRMTATGGGLTGSGIGTIRNGVPNVPADCTVTQTDWDNMFMTCTNRPPAQRWHVRAGCASIGGIEFYEGTIVTGNGTSAMNHCYSYAYYPSFVVDP